MYNRYTVSYFYSHAPYGTWLRQTVLLWSDMGFLLTRPLRDVTLYFFLDVSVQDFYSHAPYGTWLTTWCIGFIDFIISTHTPLTGRDLAGRRKSYWWCWFLLTRPLRDVTGESISFILPKSFLLTRPLRDVTYSSFTNPSAIIFLLTRPLRDVTFQHRDYKIVDHISTHTPLTGRDSNPMWYKGGDNISTHTPLTGRDLSHPSKTQ